MVGKDDGAEIARASSLGKGWLAYCSSRLTESQVPTDPPATEDQRWTHVRDEVDLGCDSFGKRATNAGRDLSVSRASLTTGK